MATRKISQSPIFRAIIAITGRRIRVNNSPSISPTKELLREASTASAARPCLARAKPSRAVAAAAGVPGMFNIMAVTPPAAIAPT